MPEGLRFIARECQADIPQVDFSKVWSTCKLIEAMLTQKDDPFKVEAEFDAMRPMLAYTFIFSYVWGMGGFLNDESKGNFDAFARQAFNDVPGTSIPSARSVYSYYMSYKEEKFVMWDDLIDIFHYNGELSYFDLMVPTVDTTRFGYLLKRYVEGKLAVKSMGPLVGPLVWGGRGAVAFFMSSCLLVASLLTPRPSPPFGVQSTSPCCLREAREWARASLPRIR